MISEMTKTSIFFFQFDNKSVQSFTEDDIVNMYPIVKHINPRLGTYVNSPFYLALYRGD